MQSSQKQKENVDVLFAAPAGRLEPATRLARHRQLRSSRHSKGSAALCEAPLCQGSSIKRVQLLSTQASL